MDIGKALKQAFLLYFIFVLFIVMLVAHVFLCWFKLGALGEWLGLFDDPCPIYVIDSTETQDQPSLDESLAQEAEQSFRRELTCAGQATGTACWKELESRPGCYVWDDYYRAGETVTWSAGCVGGLASGSGTLKRVSEGRESTGLLRGGKQTGRWVVHSANGTVGEGPYVDGKMHGHWISRFSNGVVVEGPYVDGKMHGRWVTRYPDGNVSTRTWVNGNPQR